MIHGSDLLKKRIDGLITPFEFQRDIIECASELLRMNNYKSPNFKINIFERHPSESIEYFATKQHEAGELDDQDMLELRRYYSATMTMHDFGSIESDLDHEKHINAMNKPSNIVTEIIMDIQESINKYADDNGNVFLPSRELNIRYILEADSDTRKTRIAERGRAKEDVYAKKFD